MQFDRRVLEISHLLLKSSQLERRRHASGWCRCCGVFAHRSGSRQSWVIGKTSR